MEKKSVFFPDPLFAKDDHNSTKTLLVLNDDCLLEIYKRLPLKDAKTLGETSTRLRHVYMMFKCDQLTFEFHSDMYCKISINRMNVLHNILSVYCNYIRSWSLTIVTKNKGLHSGIQVLNTVAKYCTNLKRLEFLGSLHLKLLVRDCSDVADCLKNVEVLIFNGWCSIVDSPEFLQCFRRLKHLHFTSSGTTTKDLQLLFKNNPGIESYYNHGSGSFCGDLYNFGRFTESEFNACKFGAKFHALCLIADETLNMKKMLRLTNINLTKLKINCFAKNLTIFLTEIAKRGILRELDLSRVKIDLNVLKVFRNFKELQLFVFYPHDSDRDGLIYELCSTFMWPPNLKYLRSNVHLSQPAYVSLILQLPLLTHLQLEIFRDRFRNVSTEEHNDPDKRIPTVYPKVLRHCEDFVRGIFTGCLDKLIEIDFSVPKCKKRKVFTY